MVSHLCVCDVDASIVLSWYIILFLAHISCYDEEEEEEFEEDKYKTKKKNMMVIKNSKNKMKKE